ncbi:MAG: DUF5670 family protein [Gemmatimonadaceae bacterium]
MTSLAWLALVLVGLWILVKFVFKMVSGVVHILLVLAVIAFAASYFM